MCLAENGRLKNLRGVLKSYARLMSAYRGEVLCTVTTAKVCRVSVTIRAFHGVSCTMNCYIMSLLSVDNLCTHMDFVWEN